MLYNRTTRRFKGRHLDGKTVKQIDRWTYGQIDR